MPRAILPPEIPGLTMQAHAAAELVARVHMEKGAVRLGDLSSDFLYELVRDPPASEPVRIGAAVAVRAIRRGNASGGAPLWPRRVDPVDPAVRREAYRLAAFATVALTGRTSDAVSGEDPDDRDVLELREGEEEFVDQFMSSEEEILRRKRDPVPYPEEEFLADLVEVPARLSRPGRILPVDPEPAEAGPYRIRANHEERWVRLYDFFRDKYGSPRGERRAELYIAVLAYIERHRAALEKAGEITTSSDRRMAFRDGFLEDLLGRPPGWFDRDASR